MMTTCRHVRRTPLLSAWASALSCANGLGITIVGGLLVSQLLPLTTPVVYLFFDKLQWRVMKLHRISSELEESPGN